MKQKLKKEIKDSVDENGFLISSSEGNKISRKRAFDYWSAKKIKQKQIEQKLAKRIDKNSFMRELESL